MDVVSIPAHAVRRQGDSEEFKFFIPFLDNGDVGMINYLEEVLNKKYIDKYEYGLLIRKKKDLKADNKHMILNSGIAVERASLGSVFGKISEDPTIYVILMKAKEHIMILS